MIIGIGTDIVEVVRIKRAIERTPSFLKGVFTESEVNYINSKKNRYETAAGIFSVKEAFSKAIGSGIRGFRLKDIEVLHTELGKPIINLSEKVMKKISEENYRIHVTISHTKENAVSFVIIEEVNWVGSCKYWKS